MRTPTTLDTPCREWHGTRTKAGYGHRFIRGDQVNKRGHYEYIHRWIWEQINGPIPPGMVICHHCDNPPCFRYDHLFLGTQADNAADMSAKGRATRYAAAKTHCPQGHPYDEANTYRWKNERQCRTCRREAWRRYDKKQRES